MAPFDAVAVSGSGFLALTDTPWLEIVDLDLETLSGRFVEIVVRASLLDLPARPLFRFVLQSGATVDRIGPAPVCGAAMWTGRVPPQTDRLLVSPTRYPGPFGFSVEHVHVRRWGSLLVEAARRRPKQARSSVLTRLIGWGPESDNNLAWAIGAHDFGDGSKWRNARLRAFEPAGLDQPRFDWSAAAPVMVVVRAGERDDALAITLDSLHGQSFARWTALVVGASPRPPDGADPRIRFLSARDAAVTVAQADPETLVAAIDAGDQLTDLALAFLAEQRRRWPDTHVFYGDELVAGRLAMKPGWSPRLQTARPFLGRAVFIKASTEWTEDQIESFIRSGAVPLPRPDVRHIDRVRALSRVLLVSPRSRSSADPMGPRDRPEGTTCDATVIILTADHPALLRRAVASVHAKSPPGTRIVIVDNSREEQRDRSAPTLPIEEGIVTVLRRPGPFNYSALCNEAAASSSSELLVFLNDDTEVLSGDWLERFAALAFQPDVGAIGAKLTFPDGRLQHVGVLVGMGESAGHLGAMAPAEEPGWWDRNRVVHEVSAVTGACLAVAREKFAAVGGFDSAELPVELSDIDLCLKLNARGWQTLVDPHVHLMHEESASRGGATFRRLDKYGAQRKIFVDRWRHVLRDDPFFHPGLSLYSVPVALG